MPNFCSQFFDLKAQILRNVPAGISESFARLRFSFPVAGFLVAGCGQIRGRKSLKTPLNNFASPGPRFSFPLAGFFGGRLRPDKGTQVPENSLQDKDIAPSWEQLFPLSETLRARSARAFDNVTQGQNPRTLKKSGEQMSNFRNAIKNRTMDSFLVVLQKLLSCSSQFSQSTKQGNPCQIFAHNSST